MVQGTPRTIPSPKEGGSARIQPHSLRLHPHTPCTHSLGHPRGDVSHASEPTGCGAMGLAEGLDATSPLTEGTRLFPLWEKVIFTLPPRRKLT